MTTINITDRELKAYRKEQFFRGFRACLFLIVVPMVVGFAIFCNSLINLMQ